MARLGADFYQDLVCDLESQMDDWHESIVIWCSPSQQDDDSKIDALYHSAETRD